MQQQLSIQQRGETAEGWQAVVRFNNGPENPISISNPFTEKEEQELEWYFEEYLEFPFTQKVRAREAAESISAYGEKLFDQVFGDRDIYEEYRDLVKAGLSGVQIEIEGEPKFHALHWEAMKDPKFAQPLALQATMVRKNRQKQILPLPVRPSPIINLLVVTARPSGTRDVGYRTISRPLVEALRNANLRVQVEILRPGTYKALVHHLSEVTAKYGEGHYHVIHFDMHGAVLTYEQIQSIQQKPADKPLLYKPYAHKEIQPYEGIKAFLSFEPVADDANIEKIPDLVEASDLAALLVAHQIPITILNACQSGKQVGERETSLGSHLVQQGMQLVLAMGYSVTVSAAELLMRTIYQKLFDNEVLSTAIRHARLELYHDKERRAYFDQRIDLEDWLLPVVYQNQPVMLQPRGFTPEEHKAWFERKAEEKDYTPPDPTYGFVGRDIDILQIEKRLLEQRTILLVRGMGGAGKTTLLKHLAAWWHTTGFVKRVFYFGYDEKAYTLQQIMTGIAQQLYGPRYYLDFEPLSFKAKQAMLVQHLRSENHLLVLDNLESITGTHLAIQHTLPPEEQKALHSFLADLAQGRTLILLGSRGGESWLAKQTFDDNIYDLPGLDDEAASTLADRILERNHATKYRQDPDLRRLLKLLDGFPLALEVVLANLAHQTPGDVLKALQAGDKKIDKDDKDKDDGSQKDSESIFVEKTESILRCIDYSHSNLSPQAQQLLLCLAPFTSVIWADKNILENYINELRQQPALAALPFERMLEVLREAQNWGLLSLDPDMPGFLRLQPIFPYFLRNRLYAPEQAEVRNATETAFRQHYDQLGATLYELLQSKDSKERQAGQLLIGLEYENLVTALNLALKAQVSIRYTYFAVFHFLLSIQDSQRALDLSQKTRESLESYAPDKLIGLLGGELATVINRIANVQLKIKQFAEAKVSYESELSIWEKNRSYDPKIIKLNIASIYHQLGSVAQEQRQWQQAETYYQQALQIYIEFNDRYKQAGTYHQLGNVAEAQRQWSQAEAYYQQALQIKIEFNDRYAQASTYVHLGNVALEQRQWPQAEAYYQQALQIYIEFDDRYKQASTYHGLARVAEEQQQWQKAKAYYQQALQIYIEFDDRYTQSTIYRQLGRVAQGQRQWPQAEAYYQQALQIYIEFNDRYAQAGTYHQLGMVAQEQRQWPQAEAYYQQALQIYIEFNDRYSQAGTYHQLGRVAQEQQLWQQARDYFLTALQIYIEYKENFNGGVVLRSLARLWRSSGDTNLPTAIAPIMGASVEETEKLLHEMLEGNKDKTGE